MTVLLLLPHVACTRQAVVLCAALVQQRQCDLRICVVLWCVTLNTSMCWSARAQRHRARYQLVRYAVSAAWLQFHSQRVACRAQRHRVRQALAGRHLKNGCAYSVGKHSLFDTAHPVVIVPLVQSCGVQKQSIQVVQRQHVIPASQSNVSRNSARTGSTASP
jgi:hypothetical protein